jgi:hypothetical protein
MKNVPSSFPEVRNHRPDARAREDMARSITASG